MTRGVRIRLAAFVALSAIGVVYAASAYLGIVDRVLGRGLHIHATLPASGGLFEGSEVTYRGVKVGNVAKMTVTPQGVRADLRLEEGTQIPRNAPIAVHNLSAVGEQYLDILPTGRGGPYLDDGDTLHGDEKSLPVGEEVLLSQLNGLVKSVDLQDLSTVVTELGTMFRGVSGSLQRMVDSSTTLVSAAKANQQATFDLFDTGHTVLKTQTAHEADILALSKDLGDVSGTLKKSDPTIRTLLRNAPATMSEVNSLLTGLEPVLPPFLANTITVNQVLTRNLVPLEELLVAFPVSIAAGFTGTPGDTYGHINLQMNYSMPPCTRGFLPKSRWRPGTDLADTEPYIGSCESGPPINMRGVKYAPASDGTVVGSAGRAATYDAGKIASGGKVVTSGTTRPLLTRSLLDGEVLKVLLIGPTQQGKASGTAPSGTGR